MSREWVVYVFELDDDAGPGRAASKPNLYVGETARTILERLGVHLTDKRKGSGKVRRHFRAIRFDLFEGLGPYHTREEALRAEAGLEEGLRSQGYSVVNKTGEDLALAITRKAAKPRQVGDGDDAKGLPGSGRVRAIPPGTPPGGRHRPTSRSGRSGRR